MMFPLWKMLQKLEMVRMLVLKILGTKKKPLKAQLMTLKIYLSSKWFGKNVA